jgi:DNA-binding HxlR family transcriptional regulator
MPQFLHKGKVYYNPVEFALEHIGGVWKMPILWRLKDRTLRYTELKKSIPNVSHKMLASQLRELEAHGLVHREVYAVVPPKVEYSLTEKGQAAIPVITTLRNYGLELMRAEGLTLD